MAAKIKDGLFIGDADSAGDAEFLDLNKIVNLGNLAAREVPNRFSAHGLVYLSLNWQDHNDFVLFDQSLSAVVDIVSFVDDSLRHGQSVLLFSTRGVGRCAVAACVYLMYKYRWGFEKSYDYIVSKKPDVDINRGFVHQLFLLDKKLVQLRKSLPVGSYTLSGSQLVPGVPPGPSALSRSPNSPLPLFAPLSGSPDCEKARRDEWDPSYLEKGALTDNLSPRAQEEVGDEMLLVYSYLNSKNTITAVPGPYPDALRQSKSFAIRFNPDLYLNHQYEEPGGHFVIATKTSSGKPHPPLPMSPSDGRHGASHGPGHTSGILKGGRHHNVYRRKQNKTSVGYQSDRAAPPQSEVDFDSTRSIGFDSPPRTSTLSAGGWASPEQRLHDILDDLSNHNAESVQLPDATRPNRPKARTQPVKTGSTHRSGRSGELTDTSDEDEAGYPFVSAGAPPVRETVGTGFAAESKTGGDRRDAKPVRAETKGAGNYSAGFKETGSGSNVTYRPVGEAKAAPPPSLYDLANMQVAPSFQQPVRSAVLGADDADFELTDAASAGNRFNGERKSAPQAAARTNGRSVVASSAEAKSIVPRPTDRDQDRVGSGIRPYGERLEMLEESDVGQHSMLTGGGTLVIDEDDDAMYMSAASSGKLRREDEYKREDAVTQSLLRAKHLAEDAMGRTSYSYQAQQDRQSQTVQQQDRARQRQGSAPPYSSQPPRQEAWAGVKDNTYIQATPIRTGDNRSSKESVAAAAVAAAEAMASYRNGGKVAAMPRFEGPNKTINRTDSNSSERRSSVEKRASDRPDPKSKPEWIGTSASTDSVGSGRDSIGSSRAPKVYRHGSPAPRTANTARLSQTGGGSSSSLRRDSLGRDSLGSTGGDSLGTARSRDSNNSYRRPSPSPYEQRQSSRPVSAGTARPVSRSSTPTRSEKPVDVTSGGSGSRSSTPTRSWRF